MEAIAKQIEDMQPTRLSCLDCASVKELSSLAIKLQAKLILMHTMYPEEMQIVKNSLETIEELKSKFSFFVEEMNHG